VASNEKSDTDALAQRRYFELLRARSTAQRAEILSGLCSAGRRLTESGIRATHPHASLREVQARVALRVYGQAVANRLFPDVTL
jgi:L-fucose isomerase-like protein